MSSPLAKRAKGRVDSAFIAAHQRVSHSNRVRSLAGVLSAEMGAVCKGIDIGCGDMTLMRQVRQELQDSKWTGVDVYPLPEAFKADPRWSDYVYVRDGVLPFPDGSFDVALLVDVLHHVPEVARETLLREARRVAKRIVVKDHFEYGVYSRSVLRAMDWLGNHAYGVSVPDRYFTEQSFAKLVTRSGLQLSSGSVGINLYSHLPVLKWILRPQWHFIATLQ